MARNVFLKTPAAKHKPAGNYHQRWIKKQKKNQKRNLDVSVVCTAGSLRSTFSTTEVETKTATAAAAAAARCQAT